LSSSDNSILFSRENTGKSAVLFVFPYFPPGYLGIPVPPARTGKYGKTGFPVDFPVPRTPLVRMYLSTYVLGEDSVRATLRDNRRSRSCVRPHISLLPPISPAGSVSNATRAEPFHFRIDERLAARKRKQSESTAATNHKKRKVTVIPNLVLQKEKRIKHCSLRRSTHV
jgi:hypothetical protein